MLEYMDIIEIIKQAYAEKRITRQLYDIGIMTICRIIQNIRQVPDKNLDIAKLQSECSFELKLEAGKVVDAVIVKEPIYHNPDLVYTDIRAPFDEQFCRAMATNVARLILNDKPTDTLSGPMLEYYEKITRMIKPQKNPTILDSVVVRILNTLDYSSPNFVHIVGGINFLFPNREFSGLKNIYSIIEKSLDIIKYPSKELICMFAKYGIYFDKNHKECTLIPKNEEFIWKYYMALRIAKDRKNFSKYYEVIKNPDMPIDEFIMNFVMIYIAYDSYVTLIDIFPKPSIFNFTLSIVKSRVKMYKTGKIP